MRGGPIAAEDRGFQGVHATYVPAVSAGKSSGVCQECTLDVVQTCESPEQSLSSVSLHHPHNIAEQMAVKVDCR